MKHIFLIHSSITYYVSLSVIQHDKIPLYDVIFLLDRNYRNIYSKIQVQTVNISKWERFPYPLTISSIVNSKYYIRSIDKKINEICSKDIYTLYIPTASTLFNQVLITNSLCVGYHFIEEGIANYRYNLYNEPAVSRSKAIALTCKIYNMLHSRLTLDYPFLKSYKKKAFNPQYYYLENRYHLQNVKDNTILLPFYKEQECDDFIFSNSQIFIMSPLVEFNLCSIDNLIKVIHYYFAQLKSRSIYIKYHPVQNENIKEMIVEVASKFKIAVNEIELNLPMEQVLAYSDNAKWIGFESSLLFYATILNSTTQTYSLSNRLAKLDSRYNKWLNSLPNLILNSSQQL